jgi:signal transduction histidine kinase
MEINLRRFVFTSVLLLGGIIITAFTWMSTNQFMEGMDSVLRRSMISAAMNTSVTPGHPTSVLNYTIAAQWQDLPKVIQEGFNPADVTDFSLFKNIERKSIFHRPTSGLFLVKVKTDDDKYVYVTQIFSQRSDKKVSSHRLTREAGLILMGVVAILFFGGLLIILIKTIATPVEKLRLWAVNLNEDSLTQAPPNFRYEELNGLAAILRKSVSSMREGLAREQAFVQYASHELRTPIAVIRSSIDLLKRLGLGNDENKQKKVIQRIDNASHTMADMTETLLWLSRVEKEDLACKQVRIDELIDELVDELSYLIKAKEIKLTVDTEPSSLMLPKTACRIVLGNIIRNAFQHTQQGKITIQQRGSIVKIHNQEQIVDEDKSLDNDNLGFGLGLQMVEGLTQQLEWGYVHKVEGTGHNVSIDFKVIN